MFNFFNLKRPNMCLIYFRIHKFKELQSSCDDYERILHERSYQFLLFCEIYI